MVEGSLKNDSWEKDGVKHSTLKVRVNNFSKLFRGKKSEDSKSSSNEEVTAF
jgi:single-stranded DNA-binding protein